jgi:hypothetical protein
MTRRCGARGGASVLLLSLVAGCGAPGPALVPDPPALSLRRSHYVLPPEPPAPKPCPLTKAERRCYEADWPPVDAIGGAEGAGGAVEASSDAPPLGPPRPVIRPDPWAEARPGPWGASLGEIPRPSERRAGFLLIDER